MAMQYAQLLSEGNITLLGKDPFTNADPIEPSASWHGQAIKFLSGPELSAGSLPQSFRKGCMHALFIDNDIQVCHTRVSMTSLQFKSLQPNRLALEAAVGRPNGDPVLYVYQEGNSDIHMLDPGCSPPQQDHCVALLLSRSLLSSMMVTQVNAAVSDNGELTSLGISMRQWWLMMNHNIGIDVEFNPAEVSDGDWPEDSGLSIDLENMSIVVQTQNAQVHAELIPGSNIKLEIILKDRWMHCSVCWHLHEQVHIKCNHALVGNDRCALNT